MVWKCHSDCFAVCVHRGGSLNCRHDYFANTSGILFLFPDRLTELFPTSSSLLQWINLRKTHYRQTQTYMLLYSSGVEFLMSPIKSVVSYYKKEWGQIEDYCAWHSSFIRATLSQQTSLAMFSQCLVIAEKSFQNKSLQKRYHNVSLSYVFNFKLRHCC